MSIIQYALAYKDWWSPPEEIIHIKPKDTNSTAVVKSEEPKVYITTLDDTFLKNCYVIYR